jgi:hypothetical protein
MCASWLSHTDILCTPLGALGGRRHTSTRHGLLPQPPALPTPCPAAHLLQTELLSSLALAKAEALSSFGSDAVLIEKYIEEARHIEFQVWVGGWVGWGGGGLGEGFKGGGLGDSCRELVCMSCVFCVA